MRRIALHLALTLAVLASLAIVALHSSTTVLYERGQETTPFHTDPTNLRTATRNASGEVLPLLSDLIGSTGTIVLTVRSRDLEGAGKELDNYLVWSGQLNNLVVNLDMTGSEVEEFKKLNEKNQDYLSALFENQKRFTDLKRLEVQFRDDQDPTMLSAVIIEGETLKKKMRESYTGYSQQSEAVISTAETLELDTDPYRESQREFRGVIADLEQDHESWKQDLEALTGDPTTPRQPGVAGIVFSTSPDRVRFGDTLRISGRVLGNERSGREVDLLLDFSPIQNVTTDDEGRFEYFFPIARIAPGEHTFFARLADTRSDVRTVMVETSASSIGLFGRLEGDETLVLSGNLTGNGANVRDGPVVVNVDSSPYQTVTTDYDGKFSLSTTLKKGWHTVSASFKGTGFPLTPSQSGDLVFSIRGPSQARTSVSPLQDGPLLFQAGATFGGLACGLLVAFLYLRRRRRVRGTTRTKRAPPTPEPGFSPRDDIRGETVDDDSDATHHAFENIPGLQTGVGHISRPTPVWIPSTTDEAATAFSEQSGSFPREAARILYLTLREQGRVRANIPGAESLSPREFCRKVSMAAVLTGMRDFVLMYEVVRYGRADEGRRADRLLAKFIAVTQELEGDPHERD
jgi:hypothetical protein